MKITQAQHGFREKRSCLSQLLEHYEDILKGLEDGMNVETVYLDFAKAFDKVDKGILSRRMKEKGIDGKLGLWLHNFLSDRKQFVIANNVISEVAEVKSGVPQGTVLGPLLFLIMIDSISDCNLMSTVRMFADDTRVIKHVRTEEDTENFQADLEKLYSWQEENNMMFNSAKFEVIRYGRNEDLKNTCDYLTPNAGGVIERKEKLRDLGIIMNERADFSDHVNHVCCKVNQKVGWILRSFIRRKPEFMQHMWKTYVQGHIDYCSQLWQPLQSGQLQKIERLQKSYTKRTPQVSHLNYWDGLRVLKINSQQRRLERYRIIYIWKILEFKAPNCGVQFDTNERRGRMCSLPPIAKQATQTIKSIREQSLQVHGAKLFNKLPCEIRNKRNCDIIDFKEDLDRFLTKIPDQPLVGTLIPATCNLVTGKPSNSLLDWIPLLYRDLCRPSRK